MKTKRRSISHDSSSIRESKKIVDEELASNSIRLLLRPTKPPRWSKGAVVSRSKTQAVAELALKLARLRTKTKKTPKTTRPTLEEFSKLFEYTFGEGRIDAQLIAAFYLRCQSDSAVREHLDKLVGSAAARGDTGFLHDLAKALDEQERSPWGRNRWRAFLMARKLGGEPGMTASSLGRMIDPSARNSDERASADQTARRALKDTGNVGSG